MLISKILNKMAKTSKKTGAKVKKASTAPKKSTGKAADTKKSTGKAADTKKTAAKQQAQAVKLTEDRKESAIVSEKRAGLLSDDITINEPL
jgi:hypothetical protein